VSGTLGLTALLRGRRGPAALRPQADDHDVAALADFRSRYSSPALGPVVVVIAAYNEAAGLPEVLDQLPSEILGVHTDVLVVDDGSTDGTAAAVAGHGRAHLVDPGVNRGQGAALRLGYRVAREHGARFVVTTDADGQYDPDDLPVVLGPVLAGSADFVTGSRRLGRQETRDRVRRLGVHVFAWTVSALTGHWSTDTSFGLRAMRAEVTGDVTLNQPQYQSSELLIGALSHGWRVTEVPGRMRVRSAGASKKGRNLVYGTRYARVVWGTWFREGCPAPVTERAPALARGGRG
jgi:glycosyltransferase involved in cell wall biosynthesis